MVFYALGITPHLSNVISSNRGSISTDPFYQIAFAHNLTSFGQLTHLRKWFDEVYTLGPLIFNYVKPSKSWVILKKTNQENAKQILGGTGVKMTEDGRI